MKTADILIAGIVLVIVMLIIIPLSTALLDVLLILNIAVSVFILITSLYIKNPLEFSILPTMLLITTLFRLALNVSSTKLILGNGGNAGNVIRTFGNFVTSGNLVVGLIVFIIIVAIQFIVITKGAERVSEVAARFTLDAMPGKQMAIDAASTRASSTNRRRRSGAPKSSSRPISTARWTARANSSRETPSSASLSPWSTSSAD
jgi:flagellar biosynthesis protein FlhA